MRGSADRHGPMADEAMLDLALEGADIAPLLMVLVHLTGERHWLEEVGPHIHGPWNFQESVPEDMKQRVRARMKAVLRDLATGDTLRCRRNRRRSCCARCCRRASAARCPTNTSR